MQNEKVYKILRLSVGKIAQSKRVASGQVAAEVYEYLRRFAERKDITLSKQVGIILTDWYERRAEISTFDAKVHELVAAEDPATYGDPRDGPNPAPPAKSVNGDA